MSEAPNIQRPVQNFPDYLKYVAKKSKAGFDRVHEELLRLYYDSFDKSETLKKAAVLEKPGGCNTFLEVGCKSKTNTEHSDMMSRNAKTLKEVLQPSFISYITEDDKLMSDCFNKQMQDKAAGDKPASGNTLHVKLSEFDKMRCSMPYCELANPVIYANDRVLLEEKINNSKTQENEDESLYAIPRTYLKKEKYGKTGEYANLCTPQQEQPESYNDIFYHQNQTEKHEHVHMHQQKQPELLNKIHPRHGHEEKSDKLRLPMQGCQKKSNALLSPQQGTSEKPKKRSLTQQGHPEQSVKLHAPQRDDSKETDDYLPMVDAVLNDYDKPVSWKCNKVAKESKVVTSNVGKAHTILKEKETDVESKSDDDFQDPEEWLQDVPKDNMREHSNAVVNMKNPSDSDQNRTVQLTVCNLSKNTCVREVGTTKNVIGKFKEKNTDLVADKSYVPSSSNSLVPENEHAYMNLNEFTDVSYSFSSNASRDKSFGKSCSSNATKSTATTLDSTAKVEQKIRVHERQTTKDLYAKVIKKNDVKANMSGENCVLTSRSTVVEDDYCVPNSRPILVGIDNCIPASRSVVAEGDYCVPNSRPVEVRSDYSVPISRPAIVGSDFRVPDISGDITEDHYSVPNSRSVEAENEYCVPSSIPLDTESDYSVPSSLPVTFGNDFCIPKQMPDYCVNHEYKKMNKDSVSFRPPKLADTNVNGEILAEDLYAKVDKKGYRLQTNDDYCVPRTRPVV